MKNQNSGHGTSLYAADGVNIEAGDSFSKACGKLCQSTYENSPFVKVDDFSKGHFRGPRGIAADSIPRGCIVVVAPDGIGTKTVVIVAADALSDGADNLAAMCFGDITRFGGVVVAFSNVYDTEKLGNPGTPLFQKQLKLMYGLKRVCDKHKVILLNGETAELGSLVGSENPNAEIKFNWAGFAIGLAHRNRMITGNSLRQGQVIIALRDYFRSNGISAVRKAFAMHFGNEWWRKWKAQKDIMEAATPAVVYDTFLATANGWYGSHDHIPMHFIAHLSGGAIKSKLGEDGLFPRGLSSDLPNLWSPPRIMRVCANWRGFGDKDCYTTWNGGQGALVVVDAKNARHFIKLARAYGIHAKVAGEIVKRGKPSIKITSQFTGKKFDLLPD